MDFFLPTIAPLLPLRLTPMLNPLQKTVVHILTMPMTFVLHKLHPLHLSNSSHENSGYFTWKENLNLVSQSHVVALLFKGKSLYFFSQFISL